VRLKASVKTKNVQKALLFGAAVIYKTKGARKRDNGVYCPIHHARVEREMKSVANCKL
jgi:hypothetical protein